MWAHIGNGWSHFWQMLGQFLALTGAKVGTGGALGWQYSDIETSTT